jgi:hypothetical protein
VIVETALLVVGTIFVTSLVVADRILQRQARLDELDSVEPEAPKTVTFRAPPVLRPCGATGPCNCSVCVIAEMNKVRR